MKSILFVDGTPLLDGFLHDKFETEQISFETVSNREAYTKVLSLLPNLIIIELEKEITEDILHFLEKKHTDPNAKNIPIIITGPVIERSKITNLIEYGVIKYFAKPIDFGVFFESVSHVLNIPFGMDTTPCHLEIHLNRNLIFIEIAMGLNREKLMILKYRLAEIIQKNRITVPKVILMLSNIQLTFVDGINLELLLDNVSAEGRVPNKYIKVLSLDDFVKELIAGHPKYAGIEVVDNLRLIASQVVTENINNDMDTFLCDNFLSSDKPTEEIALGFIDSQSKFENSNGNLIRIAIVDQDVVIRKLLENTFSQVSGECSLFENAASFLNSLSAGKEYDIVIMDLFLPDMDGINVLRTLQRRAFQTPIIIYSKMVTKEIILQALSSGARSFLIKPQKPGVILNKVLETINSKF